MLFGITSCVLLGMIQAAPDDSPSEPPLQINCLPHSDRFLEPKKATSSCGVPEGRQQVYDPKTGIFHIHFKPQSYAVSAFEIEKVAQRFEKPIVFRLTGVPTDFGCVGHSLVLSVGGKRY